MNEQNIDIGSTESFSEFPAAVTIEREPYWLVLTPEGEYRLFLAICPHAGGEIRPHNDVLFCPLHFWTFDATSGACLNGNDECLMQRKVVAMDGRLYAVGGNY
ncbi:Rieske (2Fe-2S) protein [Cohnella lupini]|uniref:Nitrite reductase/ring-hydroxylating ferredoxin subunit n=1 Tax=Cohnella lupini TaxID=1294267 RepID=A0A3D9IQ43_9BACL|nr:Rieske (2Fe-2S) protein [Cohnella lupini]RED63910.1 nitrite reductase/ring-hydroxylating ferredoxin subunit [Cohnella lupini]